MVCARVMSSTLHTLRLFAVNAASASAVLDILNIAPVLIACSRSHWNQAVLSLVSNVIRLLQEVDQQLWSRAVDMSTSAEEKRDDKLKK